MIALPVHGATGNTHRVLAPSNKDNPYVLMQKAIDTRKKTTRQKIMPEWTKASSLNNHSKTSSLNSKLQNIEKEGACTSAFELMEKSYFPMPFNRKSDCFTPTDSNYGQPQVSNTISVGKCFNNIPSINRCFSFPNLNKVQREVVPIVYKSDNNVVVSAPTGSGKTVILEAAFLKTLGPHFNQQQNVKVLYLAPIKALIQERLYDWQKRFGMQLGIRFLEITSDSVFHGNFDISNADVLLSTPEKWDSLTRRQDSFKYLTSRLGLIIVDEIHHIAEGSRGAILEAVISRMMNLSESTRQRQIPIASLRIVALSATFPNISDVAEWLRCPKMCFQFGSECRPVPLTVHSLGYHSSGNSFLFERNLDNRVMEVIRKYSSGLPTLIFCSSRKSTSILASHLAFKGGSRGFLSKEQAEGLRSASNKLRGNKNLKECVLAGVGYHHAGLGIEERQLMESLFINGKLPILCSTSSLALGVNLPAHLVIIKSTQIYQGSSGYSEYPKSTIQQMIGRAGRPGYDTSGVAVIMTEKCMKDYYQDICSNSNGQDIESSLQDQLLEILNSEAVLGNVADISEIMHWIKGTFFACRVKKNKSHYKIIGDDDKGLKAMCLCAIKELEKIEILRLDDDMYTLFTTPGGKIMSRNYIRFQTMTCLYQVNSRFDLAQIINCLSKIEEIQFPLRKKDKSILNEINDKFARFRIKAPSGKYKVQTVEMKTNLMIQCAIGRYKVDDIGLKQEIQLCAKGLDRILGALVEYMIERQDGKSAKLAFCLRRSLNQKIWDEDHHPLLQISGIGMASVAKLESNGIKSIYNLAEAKPHEIERILNRHQPFGSRVVKEARSIPNLEIHVTQTKSNEIASTLCIEIRKHGNEVGFLDKSKLTFTLIAYSPKKNGLVLYRKKVEIHQVITMEVKNPQIDLCSLRVRICLLHGNYVGTDKEVVFNVQFGEHQSSSPHCIEEIPSNVKDQTLNSQKYSSKPIETYFQDNTKAICSKTEKLITKSNPFEDYRTNQPKKKCVMPEIHIQNENEEEALIDLSTFSYENFVGSGSSANFTEYCSKRDESNINATGREIYEETDTSQQGVEYEEIHQQPILLHENSCEDWQWNYLMEDLDNYSNNQGSIFEGLEKSEIEEVNEPVMTFENVFF